MNMGLLSYFSRQKLADLHYVTTIMAIVILIPAIFFLAGCKQDQTTQNDTAADTKEVSEEEKTSESSDEVSSDDKAAENKGENPVVIIKTSKGDIKIELDKENAPISVDNFLTYVEDGFYDGYHFSPCNQEFHGSGRRFYS